MLDSPSLRELSARQDAHVPNCIVSRWILNSRSNYGTELMIATRFLVLLLPVFVLTLCFGHHRPEQYRVPGIAPTSMSVSTQDE